jgi:hypothetical protein
MLYDPELATEAKAIVALAFRNGLLEDLHTGRRCSRCQSASEYSPITDDEMKALMTATVNRTYTLFWLKKTKPEVFTAFIELGSIYASDWNEPDLTSDF